MLAFLGLLADLGKVLASDFRGSPTQITLAVKAVQTLQHWTRDPFGTNQTVTNP